MDRIRNGNLDILRVAAAYFIVLLHLSVSYISEGIGTMEWWFTNALSGFSRIGVPTFVMLTGAFLLDEEKKFNIRILFKKYVLKVALIFLTASVIYAVVYVQNYSEMPVKYLSKEFISKVITGHYHLWYLYMIAGLYLITPLLRAFVKVAKDSEILMFIALTAIFNMAKLFMNILDEIAGQELFKYVTFSFRMDMFVGYAGYYVAGWYLKNRIFSKRYAILTYAAGIIGYVLTVVMTGYLNAPGKQLNLIFYSNYSITVFMTCMAVFLLFCRMKSKKVLKMPFVKKVKPYKYMLLVYIIHPFFIEYTEIFKKTNLVFASIIIFVISFAVSVLLQGIFDLIKKYCSVKVKERKKIEQS